MNLRFSASGGTQHGAGLLWFVASDELRCWRFLRFVAIFALIICAINVELILIRNKISKSAHPLRYTVETLPLSFFRHLNLS